MYDTTRNFLIFSCFIARLELYSMNFAFLKMFIEYSNQCTSFSYIIAEMLENINYNGVLWSKSVIQSSYTL